MRNSILAIGILMILIYLINSALSLPLSDQQLIDTATRVLKSVVSADYINEYRFLAIDNAPLSKYPNTVDVNFGRVINGIPVAGELLFVTIDRDTSTIIEYPHWTAPTYKASDIDTNPALTADQAKWIVEKNYGKLTDVNPGLLIRGKDLWWSNITLTNGVGIDVNAATGETSIVFVPRGTISIQQVATKFDPAAYYTAKPWTLFLDQPVVTVLLLAAVGLFLSRKRIMKSVRK